jgi:hypothetical protein
MGDNTKDEVAIRWLDIAVDNAPLMSALKCTRKLTGDLEGVLESHWTAGQELRECWSFNQLENEGGHTRVFLDPMYRGDVGVIQGGQRLCLSFQARQSVWVSCDEAGQHFQRHVTM